jgi:uncharacterized protein YehS (DUF1456 family)
VADGFAMAYSCGIRKQTLEDDKKYQNCGDQPARFSLRGPGGRAISLGQ